MKKKGQRSRLVRAIRIAAVVLASYILLSFVASLLIFQTVFPRSEEIPPYEYKIEELDAERYPSCEISFLSGKNRLHGWLCGDGDDYTGTVVLVNGMNAGAGTHLPEMMFFVDRGWQVLVYDPTGVRSSEGKGTIGLNQPLLDLEAACSFLREKGISPEKTVFYGHSAGAYAAAAALETTGAAGAVCIAGFNDPSKMMLARAEEYVGLLADIQTPFLWGMQILTFGNQAVLKGADGLQGKAPVLIVTCEGDSAVPEELSLERSAGESGAVILRVDKAAGNRHSNAWLTEDAAACRENGNTADKERANQVDEEFLRQVEAFFREAIR